MREPGCAPIAGRRGARMSRNMGKEQEFQGYAKELMVEGGVGQARSWWGARLNFETASDCSKQIVALSISLVAGLYRRHFLSSQSGDVKRHGSEGEGGEEKPNKNPAARSARNKMFSHVRWHA